MNRIDEIKEVRESVMRIKLMSGMSGVIDLIDELMSEAERLTAERDEWKRRADTEEYDRIECAKALLSEIDRLTAERDAAVRDLRKDSHCLQCKKHRSEGGDCLGFSMCGKDRPGWQWRGPCAENTEGSERCETD